MGAEPSRTMGPSSYCRNDSRLPMGGDWWREAKDMDGLVIKASWKSEIGGKEKASSLQRNNASDRSANNVE